MKMNKKWAVALMMAALGGIASAVPSLQLDVVDSNGVPVGHYDTGSETTMAIENPFRLRALLDGVEATTGPNGEKLGSGGLDRFYYISAAITPLPDTPFGSFVFDTVNNSLANMRYGNPPVEDLISKDAGDLGTHGIFPTYFAEFAFKIVQTDTVAAYNTQDGTVGSGNLYYVDFDVDISGLASGYRVHFDLYSVEAKEITTGVRVNGEKTYLTSTDTDILRFAPFSHDAESVPDGGTTLVLLGSALTGIGLLRRKFVATVG